MKILFAVLGFLVGVFALMFAIGLSAALGMVYPGSGIPVSTGAAWDSSIVDNHTEWDTAYTDRLKWDGGSTDLVAATGRTSLGATTAGAALFMLTNPGAVTFLRINADNSVSALSAANFKAALSLENVTNESKTTMFTDPIFTGTITWPATVIVPDGGTFGQAAGPLLTFDDSNNYLEITGCSVGIGTDAPAEILHVVGNALLDSSSYWGSALTPSLGIRNIRPAIVLYDDNSSGNNTTALYQNGESFCIARTAYTSDDWGFDELDDAIRINTLSDVVS